MGKPKIEWTDEMLSYISNNNKKIKTGELNFMQLTINFNREFNSNRNKATIQRKCEELEKVLKKQQSSTNIINRGRKKREFSQEQLNFLKNIINTANESKNELNFKTIRTEFNKIFNDNTSITVIENQCNAILKYTGNIKKI